MNTQQAIEKILKDMSGPTTPDQVKDKCYEMTGHYPGKNEFEKIMYNMRTPVNKFSVLFYNGKYYKIKGWKLKGNQVITG